MERIRYITSVGAALKYNITWQIDFPSNLMPFSTGYNVVGSYVKSLLPSYRMAHSYVMSSQRLEASFVMLPVIAIILYSSVHNFLRSRSSSVRRPPIINISLHDLRHKPREAYERAIAQYGSIIGIRRFGRIHCMVSEDHLKKVLTDEKAFSFERGLASILNLKWLMFLDESFMRDMHQVVQEGLNHGIDEVVDIIAPVFVASAEKSVREARLNSQNRGSAVADIVASSHQGVCKAMLAILFGKEAGSDARAVTACQKVANAMISFTGIDAFSKSWHIKYFWLYRICAWTRLVMCLCTDYFPVFLPMILRARRNHHQGQTDTESGNGSYMTTILKRYVDPSSGTVPLRAIIPIACALITLIFGGIHQVAVSIVWVTFELAERPEYIPILREEMYNLCGTDSVPTYAALRKAERLDSFIREVMRTKGDVLSVVREATQDTELSGYVVQRGQLVFALGTRAHLNTSMQGFDAEQFDGMRWVGTGSLAATPSTRYLIFGLGRFACPGRMLAIAEIKLWIIALLRLATPVLEDKYVVTDLLMTASVPPQGTLLLHPLEEPLST